MDNARKRARILCFDTYPHSPQQHPAPLLDRLSNHHHSNKTGREANDATEKASALKIFSGRREKVRARFANIRHLGDRDSHC